MACAICDMRNDVVSICKKCSVKPENQDWSSSDWTPPDPHADASEVFEYGSYPKVSEKQRTILMLALFGEFVSWADFVAGRKKLPTKVPAISYQKIARMLNTDRGYVSDVVNRHLNMRYRGRN